MMEYGTGRRGQVEEMKVVKYSILKKVLIAEGAVAGNASVQNFNYLYFSFKLFLKIIAYLYVSILLKKYSII